MLVLDSSALLAIFFKEPEGSAYRESIGRNQCVISSPTYVEISSVLDAKGSGAVAAYFDQFLEEYGISILDFTIEHAKIARQSYREFGRGSASKAKLNFGDTFSYALATFLKAPLLFKGADFAHTDVRTL